MTQETLTNPDLGNLLTFSELRKDNLPGDFGTCQEAVGEVLNWVDTYLCKPHGELGRKGPVCPFVPAALEKNTMRMTVYPDADFSADDIAAKVLAERDRFLKIEPLKGSEAQFKATLILFPNLPKEKANELIDGAQYSLRNEFAPLGLMVGEFHPGPPEKGGLWNPDFRPLFCPIPMLAIRHMVPTDILFLKEEHTLVAHYLKRFPDMIPERFKHFIEEAAEKFGFNLPESGGQHPGEAPDVLYMLEKSKVPYKLHRHSQYGKEINAPADFAAVLGYDVNRITKAVFLRNSLRTIYVIAILPAEKKINFDTLSDFLEVRSLEEATPKELHDKVGYPATSVTPIGVVGVLAVIDESLLDHETILTGDGNLKMELEIGPKDLKNLSNATIVPFAE